MLSDTVHVNPWQIRKDFSYFGALGTPGVGYDTNKLLRKIGSILRLNGTQKAVLVGVGNLGSAILKYSGFESYGFNIVTAFDTHSSKIGKTINGITVEDVSELHKLKSRGIYIGIIAVPAIAAQDIADKLIDAGICGILNFVPIYLTAPKKVTIINIDIALDLARLPYYMPAKLVTKKKSSNSK
jgi:redox-sensing transcriptional repressor